MKHIIIAIDGYSSCGKSTIAKELSKILLYKYVDTGAMYRAVTLYFIQNNVDFKNIDEVNSALSKINISFKIDEQTQIQETFLNNENIEEEIRVNPRVAGFVSDVSSISEVRRFLVKQQQQFGIEKAIIMDGRDIGTVVFPDAELKLFITAEPNIRAQRRYDELKSKGKGTTFEEVLANLTKRDYIDSHRDDSPLMKANDAIELDNFVVNSSAISLATVAKSLFKAACLAFSKLIFFPSSNSASNSLEIESSKFNNPLDILEACSKFSPNCFDLTTDSANAEALPPNDNFKEADALPTSFKTSFSLTINLF